jgi:pimeloyl-ACP methyl ester carboxylesterase
LTVHLFFLSGVATSADFMEPLQEELIARYRLAGIRAAAYCLLPYGDWSRPVLRQINEVRQDLMRRDQRLHEQGRAERIAAVIRDSYREGSLILIGHSAGGTAAVQAARLLLREGVNVSCIVQIGSPKFAIPPELRSLVLYLFAVNRKRGLSDPIVRIGSWGGWQRGPLGMPVWNPLRRSPSQIIPVPIIGGHADYFRRNEPYRDGEGKNNLTITTDAIWEYLTLLNK